MLDWLLFNTFLPLMPIPLTKGVLWLCGLKRGWANLVRDGQICFYSTSLCAISIHDFFKLPKSPINAGLVVATLIFFMLFRPRSSQLV